MQIQDRLARTVSRQLRLGAVGVEDAKQRLRAPVGRLAQQQHSVRVAAEVGRADAPDALGGQLEGERVALDDDVVVAERLPLLEPDPHGPGTLSSRSTIASAVRCASRPLRSTSSTSASLRIQVSWRLAYWR